MIEYIVDADEQLRQPACTWLYQLVYHHPLPPVSTSWSCHHSRTGFKVTNTLQQCGIMLTICLTELCLMYSNLQVNTPELINVALEDIYQQPLQGRATGGL